MTTEDGKEVFYNTSFWIVVLKNHAFDIGTNQELELYKPYKAIIHNGAGINMFGRKAFSTEQAANDWIIKNKT